MLACAGDRDFPREAEGFVNVFERWPKHWPARAIRELSARAGFEPFLDVAVS